MAKAAAVKMDRPVAQESGRAVEALVARGYRPTRCAIGSITAAQAAAMQAAYERWEAQQKATRGL